jgi:hypothetical protein
MHVELRRIRYRANAPAQMVTCSIIQIGLRTDPNGDVGNASLTLTACSMRRIAGTGQLLPSSCGPEARL